MTIVSVGEISGELDWLALREVHSSEHGITYLAIALLTDDELLPDESTNHLELFAVDKDGTVCHVICKISDIRHFATEAHAIVIEQAIKTRGIRIDSHSKLRQFPTLFTQREIPALRSCDVSIQLFYDCYKDDPGCIATMSKWESCARILGPKRDEKKMGDASAADQIQAGDYFPVFVERVDDNALAVLRIHSIGEKGLASATVYWWRGDLDISPTTTFLRCAKWRQFSRLHGELYLRETQTALAKVIE